MAKAKLADEHRVSARTNMLFKAAAGWVLDLLCKLRRLRPTHPKDAMLHNGVSLRP